MQAWRPQFYPLYPCTKPGVAGRCVSSQRQGGGHRRIPRAQWLDFNLCGEVPGRDSVSKRKKRTVPRGDARGCFWTQAHKYMSTLTNAYLCTHRERDKTSEEEPRIRPGEILLHLLVKREKDRNRKQSSEKELSLSKLWPCLAGLPSPQIRPLLG